MNEKDKVNDENELKCFYSFLKDCDHYVYHIITVGYDYNHLLINNDQVHIYCIIGLMNQ